MVGQTIDKDAADGVLLTPAHPEVNPYILSVIKEMLAYDVDGIHLDYCRYWNAAFDYSEAARKGCRAKLGFDPLNFLDHPERIVPANKDPFPIRVLHPKTQIGKVVELGHTERNMWTTCDRECGLISQCSRGSTVIRRISRMYCCNRIIIPGSVIMI